MKQLKKGAAFLLSLSMSLGTGISPVLAKTEARNKITSVTLHISAELGEDSDFSDMSLQITAGSGNYSLDEYEVVNDTGSSAYPIVQVTLDAENGYYFDVSSKGISLEGEEADCTAKNTKNDKETLVLKIKLTDLTANLNPVSSAELDSDGEGTWTSVAGARKYELRLYRGSTMVGSSKNTSDTEYDFSSMITRKGDYFFKVRAIGHNSGDKSDWTKSDSYYFDESLSSSSWWDDDDDGPGSSDSDSPGSPGGPDGPGNPRYTGGNGGPGNAGSGWQQNQNGWWYKNADGSYPVSAWLFTDNNWFHFDNSGYMQTGWINDGGRLFYLNPYSDGTKGKMMTGWQCINGKYYYFNPVSDGSQGALLTNTTINGKYRVGADGAWIQ